MKANFLLIIYTLLNNLTVFNDNNTNTCTLYSLSQNNYKNKCGKNLLQLYGDFTIMSQNKNVSISLHLMKSLK